MVGYQREHHICLISKIFPTFLGQSWFADLEWILWVCIFHFKWGLYEWKNLNNLCTSLLENGVSVTVFWHGVFPLRERMSGVAFVAFLIAVVVVPQESGGVHFFAMRFHIGSGHFHDFAEFFVLLIVHFFVAWLAYGNLFSLFPLFVLCIRGESGLQASFVGFGHVFVGLIENKTAIVF